MRKKKKTSAVDELRAELDRRRERVAACQARLDKVREAGEADLARAQALVNEYVSKVAEALGLPDPLAAEKKRQKVMRLRKLAKDAQKLMESCPSLTLTDALKKVGAKVGASREEVAELLAAEGPEVVEKGTSAPESSTPPTKRDLVRSVYLSGKTRASEISKETGVPVASVYVYLSALRRAGLLPAKPKKETEEGEGAAGNAASKKSKESSGGDDEESSESSAEPGSSVDELREEVSRQQDGHRAQQVRLVTTAGGDDEHDHVAVLDRFGDGVTAPDDTEHQHRVYRFVVGGAAKHRHGLLAEPPATV